MIRWVVFIGILSGLGTSIVAGRRRGMWRHFFWRRVVVLWACLLLIVVIALLPLKTNSTSNAVSNRDILFLVDTTQSMNAIDGREGNETTRLENARQDMRSIAEANAGANIGIYTFSDQTSLFLPLTTGTEDVSLAIDTVYTATRFNVVNKVAPYNQVFKDVGTYLESQQRSDPTRQRIVIMLSDFEIYNNQEQVEEVVASANAIKTYGGGFVGLLYGQPEGARMLNISYDYLNSEYAPSYKLYGDDEVTKYVAKDYKPVTSVPNPSLADAIAAQLGGTIIKTRDSQAYEPAIEKAAQQSSSRAAQNKQAQALNQNIIYILPALLAFGWLCVSDIILPAWLRVFWPNRLVATKKQENQL